MCCADTALITSTFTYVKLTVKHYCITYYVNIGSVKFDLNIQRYVCAFQKTQVEQERVPQRTVYPESWWIGLL